MPAGSPRVMPMRIAHLRHLVVMRQVLGMTWEIEMFDNGPDEKNKS
jgi:hypothetical protein